MKNRIIILFVTLGVILLMILGVLYTNKNNESPNIKSENLITNILNSDNNNEIDNSNEDVKKEIQVKNNGRYFVQIEDKIYFWKLKKESRKETALFGQYSEDSTIKNDLICMNSLGEQNVILNDFGIGKIYVSNNKLFLSSHTNLEKGITYSIDLDGQNKKVYENIEEIIDANNNYIIYKSNSKVYTMNTNNDKYTEVFNIGEYEFLKLYNDNIYYYKTPQYGDTTITLKSMNLEGKQNKVIKEISVEGIQIQNDYSIVDIMQFDIDNNNFYVSYGYTDGTAQIVQDSEICIFRKDNEKESTILKGYNKFEFYEENDNKYLVSVLNENVEQKVIIDIKNFDKIVKDIPKNIFKDEIILTDVFKANYSAESDDILIDTINIDKIDGYAYYLLDISKPFPEENVGWRTAYKQEKSYCIKQNLQNAEYQILYEF